MAWLGLDKFFLGVDLDAEQARSDRLDAEITTQNLLLLDRGVWTPEQYAIFEEHTTGPTSTYGQDVVGQVNEAFQEGLQEGITNERNFFGKTIDAIITTPLRLIPWQAWVIGLAVLGVYLFINLGGMNRLRKTVGG